MAKADLRKAESDAFREGIAWVVREITKGLLLKEIAARIKDATGKDVDERQIARWQNGAERPQFDLLWAVTEWHQPIVLAFAALAGAAVEIETIVRVRRTA